MGRVLFSALASVALTAVSAAPASAAAIINANGSVTANTAPGSNTVPIMYNGLAGDPNAVLTPGLSAYMILTFNGFSGNTANFTYSLQNTSTVANTRISGIGFNVSPNVTSIAAGAGSVFDVVALNTNFASIGNVEACFSGGPGDCPQSNPGNSILFGQTGNGTLSFTFAGPQTSVTLDNFFIRYQGFTTTNILGQTVTSAVGVGTPPVPEPATWAMMLVGFGGIGMMMRRRRRNTVLPQLA